MTTWAISLFWILLGLAVGQAVLAWRFTRVLKRTARKPATDGPCPKTAVILCLRGPDPFLPACLEAVLSQDYPHYDLHIVVDSREDPAWAIAEQAVAAHGGHSVHMRALAAPGRTCSLKCSSLVQVVSELDDSYEAIAQLDADTIPHRTWLRELVAPLADERVAAATGNRWYVPAAVSWGSLVRRLWNTAAVVQMHCFRIPWGGTLALKLSVVRRSDLLERWSNALCEDTMLYSVLRRMGYRVAFVPSLMMVNREGCTLESFYRWVRRQLLTARLYHPAWGLVVGYGLSISVAHLMGVAAFGAAAIARNGHAAAWLVSGMALYWGIMVGLLAVIESGVRRNTQSRGEPLAGIQFSDVPRTLAAMLLTQGVYAAALLSAIFLRTVDWRGIRYRVDGPAKIRMIEYKPYAGGCESQSVRGSL
jgi:glycosyltransferase involved in cell wall biosynthesis